MCQLARSLLTRLRQQLQPRALEPNQVGPLLSLELPAPRFTFTIYTTIANIHLFDLLFFKELAIFSAHNGEEQPGYLLYKIGYVESYNDAILSHFASCAYPQQCRHGRLLIGRLSELH